jgi:hypothetical protein
MKTTEVRNGVVRSDGGEWETITYTASSGPLAGITLVEGEFQSDHPQAGRHVKFVRTANKVAFQQAGIKQDVVRMRVADKPDLAALADEVEAIRQARRAPYKTKHAEEYRQTQALLAQMREEEARLVTLIPADHVRVTATQIGDADGWPIVRYECEGEEVALSHPEVVRHGTAYVQRPGAMNPFATVDVLSIPRTVLETLQAARLRKKTAKAQAVQAKEEECRQKFEQARATGQPVALRNWSEPCCERDYECSLDIVTEYALPDGGTRRDRIHTH